MIFKRSWEKTDQHIQINDQSIQAMIAMGFSSSKYISHRLISGGCANLNIQVLIDEDHETSIILRIYLRDSYAALREQKLAELLCEKIPIPSVYFVGEFEDYTFAIIEYKPGITLRDYLLDRDRKDMSILMEEVGSLLAKIHQIRFTSSGFFDENLSVSQQIDQKSYRDFAQDCLQHPTVLSKIGEELIAKIDRHFKRFGDFLPADEDYCLVHADYDPANILVDYLNGRWRITAILDWEFAFSGSPLWDVANMLRYSHQMPKTFKIAFLDSLRLAGMEFPQGWRISTHLLNLLSLLDCLVRSPLNEQSNQCRDICELIEHINRKLDKA